MEKYKISLREYDILKRDNSRFRREWKLSEETKEKIGRSNKGKKRSEETKEKMRKPKSEKTREKMRNYKIKCPFCNKVGGNAMKRWHFNNCKQKIKNYD